MGKLMYRIRGEAEAEIFGVFPEAAVNRCTEAGISLRGVQAVDGQTLRCAVDERDLARLRAECERCQCELRLLQLRGGSRYRRALRLRMWLLLTALLTAAMLLLSSLFIWDIEVIGAEQLNRGRILRALSDAGLARGCFWPSLSGDSIRSRAILELPELSWLSVNISGSRAAVLVREREEKPEIYRESAACSLIASQSGIVRRVSVLNGKALVRAGQAVQMGEVLVSGTLDSITGPRRFVRARGEVWADTWYELTAICPPASANKTEVLWKSSRFALQFGENRINFYGKSRNSLDGYDTIVQEYDLGLKGLFALPIRIVREDRLRYRTAEAESPAVAPMQKRLESYLQGKIAGEIVSRSFSVTEKDGAVYVTMRARCFENIAQIQETQAEAPSP